MRLLFQLILAPLYRTTLLLLSLRVWVSRDVPRPKPQGPLYLRDNPRSELPTRSTTCGIVFALDHNHLEVTKTQRLHPLPCILLNASFASICLNLSLAAPTFDFEVSR